MTSSFVAILALSGALSVGGQQASRPRIYDPVPAGPQFAFGADLSFLKQAEDGGTVFKDGETAKPGLVLFRDHGYNWIRLRLFVEPVKRNLPNNLAYTIAMAKDAKKLGYRFLLDFHYAQSWADPQQQPMPDAWLSLPPAEQVTKVFEYTRDSIVAFREAGVLPDMVQVGNEVRNGMLWPAGKLPENWDNFAEFTAAGINGVDAGRGNGRRPRIMVQYDNGGSIEGSREFYDKLLSYGIGFDVIGYSYYPWWHGSIQALRENLRATALRYGKEVMVVEAAYHYAANRETEGKAMPFPETPEGQKQFLEEVTRAVMDVPNGLGTGVFWWEPATARFGTRGCFDKMGKALPSMYVFDKFALPKT